MRHAIAILILVATWVQAQGAVYSWQEEQSPDILFAEQGDSFLRLFGPDWQRVFEANKGVAFYDRHGRLVVSPEKLVMGQRLTIPPGTFLTPEAKARVLRFRQAREAARKAIAEAQVRSASVPQNTKAFREGTATLEMAKTKMGDISYGFENYREAKLLADKAMRILAAYREEKKEMPPPPELTRNLSLPIVAGLLFSILGSLYLLTAYRKRQRIAATNRWLAGHQKRVRRLLHQKI